VEITKDVYTFDVVKCEVCQFENCHPIDVQIAIGDHTITVAHEGIRIDPPPNFTRRGVIIAITFMCENGDHQFSLNYAFHKGSTSKSRLIGPKLKNFPYVIWRD